MGFILSKKEFNKLNRIFSSFLAACVDNASCVYEEAKIGC